MQRACNKLATLQRAQLRHHMQSALRFEDTLSPLWCRLTVHLPPSIDI